MKTTEQRYKESLEQIEQQLRRGQRLFKNHGGVEAIADEHSTDKGTVMEDLRQRNPDVPDHAFQSGLKAHQSWDGVPSDDLHTPSEERNSLYRDGI